MLAWAIQQDFYSLLSIETYLNSSQPNLIKYRLACIPVRGKLAGSSFPILFFAIELNSPQIVSLLIKAGADPNGRAKPSDLPVLAYRIISAEYQVSDATDTLIALLVNSASADDILKDMWEHYVETPKRASHGQGDGGSLDWCTPEVRNALCRSLTLIQRYCLWKSKFLPRQTEFTKDVDGRTGTEKLFQVPYHIIGQFSASQQVIDTVTGHLTISSKPPQPLVLLFAGPSGHGKTELARRMGDLLSVDIHIVDCTETEIEKAMFGGKRHWKGCETEEDRSPLNRFLVEHTGTRSVLFLDEFDKTTDEVREDLLLPFESGFYKERKFGKQIDCCHTIWIMASNYGEGHIKRFWDQHLYNLPEERQLSASWRTLQNWLEEAFIDEFGAPTTGRISAIIPFIPFTGNEQAVIAYTFMRKLRNEVRKDINDAAMKFVGHAHLNFLDDAHMARHLATKWYGHRTGARSLHKAVKQKLALKLAQEVRKGEERVTNETNESNFLVRYNVCIIDGADAVKEIEIKKEGYTPLRIPDKVKWTYDTARSKWNMRLIQ